MHCSIVVIFIILDRSLSLCLSATKPFSVCMTYCSIDCVYLSHNMTRLVKERDGAIDICKGFDGRHRLKIKEYDTISLALHELYISGDGLMTCDENWKIRARKMGLGRTSTSAPFVHSRVNSSLIRHNVPRSGEMRWIVSKGICIMMSWEVGGRWRFLWRTKFADETQIDPRAEYGAE